MNTNLARVLGLVIVLGAAAAIILTLRGNLAPAGSSPSSTSSSSSSEASRLKFQGSQYDGVSYQIFPGSLSSAAQTALRGFDMTTNPLSGGSTQVTLSAKEPQYRNQTYTVKPGETLYFVDQSSSDDSVSFDAALTDDTAIIVDSQGYIVQ